MSGRLGGDKREKKLNRRQIRFIKEYMKDHNASAAARRAGYKGQANVVGPLLLANVSVAAELDKQCEELFEKIDVTDQMILNEVRKLGFFNAKRCFDANGNPLEIHEMDDDTAAAIAGFEFVTLYDGSGEQRHAFGQLRKFKIADKRGALELLGRHRKLWTDKVEHGLDDDTKRFLATKLDLTNATPEQLAELTAFATGGSRSGGDK
jgi:phage terminase small subunit